MPKSKLNAITLKIKATGISQREWAISNGFNPQTVAHVINGTGGVVFAEAGIGISGKIMKQLKKDGFLDEAAQ